MKTTSNQQMMLKSLNAMESKNWTNVIIMLVELTFQASQNNPHA